MKLSLITVSHHSAEVLPACLGAFRHEVARLGVDSEEVVVEQSEDARVAASVRQCGATTVLERANNGYAAGLNAGVEVAVGDTLLLVNPDVELVNGSLDGLLRGLGEHTVVGPQLVWDRAGALLLPVPEDPSPRAEMRRALRRCSPRWWYSGLHEELEGAWRVWRASGPEPVPSLRGPALLLRRRDWEQLGPMDEGYFLYYEETEWLWRAVRRGSRLALVGGSFAQHRWGHATRRLTERDELEARSRARFLRRNYSPLARWAIRWLERRRQRSGVSAEPVTGPEEVPNVDADLWLVSPFPHLMPATGCLGALSPVVRELAARGQWFAAAASRRRGRWQLEGSWRWEAA